MKIIGNGILLSLLPEDTILAIKNARMEEHPNGDLNLVLPNGGIIGIIAELMLAPSDYKKREQLVVRNIKPGSREDVRGEFKDLDKIPIYTFDIITLF